MRKALRLAAVLAVVALGVDCSALSSLRRTLGERDGINPSVAIQVRSSTFEESLWPHELALPDQADLLRVVFATEEGLPASQLERVGSALKEDPLHRAVSWVVDDPAAQRFTITGGDGVERALYQLPGEVNGKPGVFEWIIDESGEPVINHQRFIPGGEVTGYPNQRP